MKQICENPYFGKKKKGPLKDIYGHKIYHIRTQYVISYKIIKVLNETQKRIEFIKVVGRGDDYKGTERYVRAYKHN